MEKILLAIIITVGFCFFDFAQEGVTLNTDQNLFAVNEAGRVLFKSKLPKSQETIDLFVDTLATTEFEFRSTIFPENLVIDTFPDGHIDTTILIGSQNIKALEVSVNYFGNDKINIGIQDNRLVAVQQALDSSGNWVSLEHFIHSDCGNSYSTETFRKGISYVFKIARYVGNYPTKLRLKALINKQIVYSNEFNGSINYEQLNSVYNKTESEMVFR